MSPCLALLLAVVAVNWWHGWLSWNVGSSVGISIVSCLLTRNNQVNYTAGTTRCK
jgi:hypothetical protein